MAFDMIFIVIVVVGLASKMFYKPDKVREWIMKRFEGTFLEPQNAAQEFGMEMVLLVPTYLQFLVRFGIMGFIFFRAYDIIGYEKTIIILLILIYVWIAEKKVF